MKNLISEHQDFICAVLAISFGMICGFTGAHLIQTAANQQIKKTCNKSKVVAIRTLLTTESLYCLKQTD